MGKLSFHSLEGKAVLKSVNGSRMLLGLDAQKGAGEEVPRASGPGPSRSLIAGPL